uniref:Mitochondrial import inner membrane translocase subunit TIM50 n=1 Tax=Drosophila melanogaster TaxID=7227 RepID=X2JEK6_DROME|nr:dullard, isoform C [Drosophila melanogaster]AHN59986.1 dullard, isoform C [Drosophila melanogaster]|eukprot:NP_001285516.1 dullard, isoform C [Drosophila melanogaster]
MISLLQMKFRALLLLLSKVWTCICFMFNRQVRAFIQYQPVKYELFPLSPVSRHRLSLVQRKTLVLDLDETLIHSHHNAMPRNTVKPGTPHDFTVKVTIDRNPVRFFVHKRPHVDYFLDVIFIIDNSPGAYRCFPNNAIPIKSWFSDPMDTALLSLLPMLDALRFTNDVRSVLSRNLHLHRLW